MREITISPKEYTECFLELAKNANEKFKIVRITSNIVVLLVTISFINQYGF